MMIPTLATLAALAAPGDIEELLSRKAPEAGPETTLAERLDTCSDFYKQTITSTTKEGLAISKIIADDCMKEYEGALSYLMDLEKKAESVERNLRRDKKYIDLICNGPGETITLKGKHYAREPSCRSLKKNQLLKSTLEHSNLRNEFEKPRHRNYKEIQVEQERILGYLKSNRDIARWQTPNTKYSRRASKVKLK